MILTLVLRQGSVTLYVLVITIGQVPVLVCVLVTTRLASMAQLSPIRIPPANASKAATVVTAAGALATVHPSTFVGVRLPVTDGGVVSVILMVWMILTLVLRHASVTLYVLVTTIGHVPADVCVLVTTRLPSTVHPSVIWRFPVNASNAATVVTAAGAAPTAHPSTVVGVMLPVTAGAMLSSTLMVWMMFTLVLRHRSVTLYVLVITIGQVPVDVCVFVTTRLPSVVHASVI